MVKGFTDSKGKFRPTDNNSGTSSREKSTRTTGMSEKRAREFVHMFINPEERPPSHQVEYPYEGEVTIGGMVAPYNVRLPEHVIVKLDSMGGLWSAFQQVLDENAISSTGGGFGDRLKEGNLRSAWQKADFQNRWNLMQLTGMDENELEKFAYGTTHPDEQITYTLSPEQYLLASEGGTTEITDQRRK